MPAFIESAARRHLLLATAGALMPLATAAQDGAHRSPAPSSIAVPSQRVHFARRGGMRTVRDRLHGPNHGVRDYVLHGRAGQTLEVELETLAPGVSFKVQGPQSKAEALFMSEFSALPRWRSRLPADGTYRVRVSLHPIQLQRGAALRFTLRLTLTGG